MSNFTFLPQGAIIQEFSVNGHNIVQGFQTADQYKQYNKVYYGQTIGRVANRISGAKIQSLNKNQSYSLTPNNGPNTLHGGKHGWGEQLFEGPKPLRRNGKESVQFTYLSPDGDEGFPGTVELRVWYTASEEDDAGRKVTVLNVEYEVEMVGDDNPEETVVAVTNHRSESAFSF